MLATNLVTLYRRDDPRHEIREVWIYTIINPCEVWQAIRFLDDEYPQQRSKLALGSLRDMEAKHAELITQLQGEGFVICKPAVP
jgi:hypothetical protein